MLSLTKLVQSTKVLLHPRLVFSFQNANISTKNIEERLGIPPRPKKPLTPYFQFLKEARPQLLKENPKLSTTDIVKMCATKWSKVDEASKQKMLDVFKIEQAEYVKKRAQYDSKLTEDQKYEIENAKAELQESREKRAYRKKLREMEKPKRPASGFLRYLSAARDKLPRGNMSYREWQHKAAEAWNNLPDDQKNSYNEAAKNDAVKYKQELAKWELKMVRLGNVDLVRQEALVEQSPNKPNRRQKSRTE